MELQVGSFETIELLLAVLGKSLLLFKVVQWGQTASGSCVPR